VAREGIQYLQEPTSALPIKKIDTFNNQTKEV